MTKKVEQFKWLPKKYRNAKLAIWSTFVARFFSIIRRLVSFKTVYFLDTNMVVARQEEGDRRLRRAPMVNRNFFVTEINELEIKEKLADPDFRKIFSGEYSVVRFEQLRFQNPAICPLYYNFVFSAHNSANITSPTFFLEQTAAHRIIGRIGSKKEEKFKVRLMSKLADGARRSKDMFGQKKRDAGLLIDEAFFKWHQKKNKKTSRSDKNEMNDYKSFAIALVYALQKKQNVYFYTADIDIVAILTSLLDSVAHQMVMKQMVIENLTNIDKERILNGKPVTRFLDLKTYTERVNGVLLDIFNDDWKGNAPFIGVKYWDQKKQKYREAVGFAINDLVRDSLLHEHQGLSCHYSGNWTHGDWIRLIYWWPPTSEHQGNYFKVAAVRKNIINKHSIFVPEELHETTCKYRMDDRSNSLRKYVNFWTQK